MKKEKILRKYAKYKDVMPFSALQHIFSDKLMDPTVQPKWTDIPEKIVIGVAPIGAFIDKSMNPNHHVTPDEIVKESIAGIEAGAVGLHVQARDDLGRPTTEAKYYHKIIDPIRKRYGDKVVIDGGTLTGKMFLDGMTPVIEGLLDIGYVCVTTGPIGDNVHGSPPKTMQAQIEFYKEHNVKPMFDVHDTASINQARRFRIETGMVEKPYAWHVLLGLPRFMYIPTTRAVVDGLMYMVDRIRELDENSFILRKRCGTCRSLLNDLSNNVGPSHKGGDGRPRLQVSAQRCKGDEHCGSGS